ncbi:hypothetical protein [Specibacter sp. RAF43]|uniref:hypothetical protein n=1 Tax=Specibacter sp. RAF43 TaxID=3233057 RepID=UPI003F987273
MLKASTGLVGIMGSAWGAVAAFQVHSTIGIVAAAASAVAAVVLLVLGARAVLRD